jgi:hypothetical protein
MSKPRETTARFTTDECKIILMAMNYSKSRDLFLHEGDDTVSRAYGIVAKLKFRIEEERKKKDKVIAISIGGE